MKKSIKMILGTSVLSLSLLASAIPGFASTVTEQNASGGWSESGGYYTNSPVGISAFSSTSPEEHHGERKSRDVNPGGEPVYEYASYGYTVWQGEYHYTTAQIEKTNGTVKTTSGRQWGTGGTTALSPYYLPGIFENIEARTYWGN
ncbi:hypothetical protein [Paenibacillus qinlingensis]|uniref:hypothetical protein n=1 Tax=Paenibacillus qinlingensis TaxID=1837343 RepID=UPI00156387B7|nr:hypothetical protein [Paenibacillus qinlingensis]NQX62200.1 hypothetical protein [Paenibacillus qinlingensis]